MSTQPTEIKVNVSDTVSPKPVAYELFYRTGMNPHPQSKHFYLDSKDMKTVIDRARKHCEIMNIKFVSVKPFWTDLGAEEKIVQMRDN